MSATCTPSPPAFCKEPFRSSAAATIAVESAVAPAWTIAVLPSCEIETPARGSTTLPTRESVRSTAATRWTAAAYAGSAVVFVSECSTTIRPEDERPPNSCWTTLRTTVDSEPDASQPAPESACSAFGANTPSAMATTTQVSETSRT